MPATITTATIGYPRTGPRREMKKALESYWAGKTSKDDLITASQAVEEAAWRSQADAGIELVSVDGTFYDHVLDIASCLGLLPERFANLSGLDAYFAAARGADDLHACDMSKYYDTNYHYIVPELGYTSTPKPDWEPLLDRAHRCQAAIGVERAVPLLAVGPLSFVHLAKGEFDRSEMIARLIPAYVDFLEQLGKLGVPEVQIHEPVFATSTGPALQRDAEKVYAALAATGVPLNIVIPFDDVEEKVYQYLVKLPVAALGLDFLSVPGNTAGNRMAQLIATYGFPKDKCLGAGVIDGRSVWADDGTAARIVAALRDLLGEDQSICVQTSTSLQFVPVDVTLETSLPPDVAPRLAFATQKLSEIVRVAKAACDGSAKPLDLSAHTGKAPLDVGTVDEETPKEWFQRSEPYEVRREKQLANPPLATTTIGSFPQTQAIRQARLLYRKGQLSEAEYDQRMAAEIGYAVGMQDALGLDVLVHGEPERTDMVEHFGINLNGFAFTKEGWVQSYGSRYVRPPIITGDVSRCGPMTVKEYKLAQAVTTKPVKGMLTGPVTMLNWSFPRKDISRHQQAMQIALALRAEVADLEAAGCRILQVDEPAIREGLPLKTERWQAYLDWATAAFRLATGIAGPSVQIVTHLCYSSFEDIMAAIDALDADVLTIENSRSDDEMVRALAKYAYNRDLGPGIYDVHSPAVPTVDFMAEKIRAFLATGVLGGDPWRLWVNPDCGLKTRKWEEVLPALRNMVAAAKIVRQELQVGDVHRSGQKVHDTQIGCCGHR